MSVSVQKTTLKNGVRVLGEKVPGVRSISIGVLIDVGSKDEKTNQRGYAHLVEHMLFQGTGERDAKAIAEMMEIAGGAIGAFTTRDYTVYHATVLDEYLPFALEVLGDMLCDSVLPEEALERQKSVILNEIAEYDDPLRSVNDSLKRTLWPGHALGYPTAGTNETVSGATRTKLRNFRDRHYIAQKCIVAGAGNLDHELFAAQVQDAFWPMQEGKTIPRAPGKPKSRTGVVTVTTRELQQVYFALAWPAPAYTHKNRYAYHVFSSLFGGGPTSRLYRALREERGMVYYIGCQYQAYSKGGAMVVEGATSPQTLIPVLANIIIELLRMADEGVTVEDHHRAVQSIVSQHLVTGDSAYVRMSRLVLQEHYFKRLVTSDEVAEGIKAQKAESVVKVATDLLNIGLPTISLTGPLTDELVAAVIEMLGEFGDTPPELVSDEQRVKAPAARLNKNGTGKHDAVSVPAVVSSPGSKS